MSCLLNNKYVRARNVSVNHFKNESLLSKTCLISLTSEEKKNGTSLSIVSFVILAPTA